MPQIIGFDWTHGNFNQSTYATFHFKEGLAPVNCSLIAGDARECD